MPSHRGGESHGLLVLKCGHSLFCLLLACAKFNSANVETVLLLWASLFGMPRILITDGGSHFKNALIASLTRRMRAKHHITTPYDAWANGAIERLNRAIIAIFRTLLGETGAHWEQWNELRPLVNSILNQKTQPSFGRVESVASYDGPPHS